MVDYIVALEGAPLLAGGSRPAAKKLSPKSETLEAMCERLEKMEQGSRAPATTSLALKKARARLTAERDAGTTGPLLERLEAVCDRLERLAVRGAPIRKGDERLRINVEKLNALDAMEATMIEMGYDPNAETDDEVDE